MVAAAYAGFAGGLLGVMQGFMPPDAFMFDTSGQLVMQTAIGGAGTLFGPLVGAAIWLYLSDFFQNTLHLGSAWRLVLGIVFVLLVVFLTPRRHRRRQGPCRALRRRSESRDEAPASDPAAPPPKAPRVFAAPKPAEAPAQIGEIILETKQLTRRYGGLLANRDIDFSVRRGELRGVIGPNGAGKTHVLQDADLRRRRRSSGQIVFEQSRHHRLERDPRQPARV